MRLAQQLPKPNPKGTPLDLYLILKERVKVAAAPAVAAEGCVAGAAPLEAVQRVGGPAATGGIQESAHLWMWQAGNALLLADIGQRGMHAWCPPMSLLLGRRHGMAWYSMQLHAALTVLTQLTGEASGKLT